MAEIDIQKKKGPSPWVWVAVAVGVLLLVGVIWAVTQNGDTRDRDAMPADTVRDTAPATWDTAPPAGDTVGYRASGRRYLGHRAGRGRPRSDQGWRGRRAPPAQLPAGAHRNVIGCRAVRRTIPGWSSGSARGFCIRTPHSSMW
jgi:hypothetical protein